MSYAATPSGQQIDIAASVRAAYQFAVDNARLGVDLAWLPYAVLIGAAFLAWLIAGGGWFGTILAMLLHAAAFAIFGSVFIVRWYRYILLGETVPGTLFPPGWGTFFLTVVKLGIAMFIAAFVILTIAAVLPSVLAALLGLAGYIALAVAWSRVSLVFPAAAIERPLSLREAWEVMAGNYWRLFACLLACYVPFGIVHYLLNRIADSGPAILSIVFEAIGLAVSFAGIAIVAALLSDVYRGFYPPVPQTADRRAS